MIIRKRDSWGKYHSIIQWVRDKSMGNAVLRIKCENPTKLAALIRRAMDSKREMRNFCYGLACGADFIQVHRRILRQRDSKRQERKNEK